jgi:electron transfer flavoprotein alpha subunit
MERILFLAHTESDGTLHKSALETLSAALELGQALGADVAVGLFGEDADKAARSIGTAKATAWYAVSGNEFAQPRYSTDVIAVAALIQKAEATLVLAPASLRLSRCIAGAAQRSGGRVDTSLTRIEVKDGKPVATRWYYRQRMVGALTREQRPWVMTISPGCYAPFAEGAAEVTVEPLAVELPESAKRTQVHGIQTPAVDEQTIRPDATVLLVAGAGWTKKQADGAVHAAEASTLILGFLGKAQASLGSSKSLVDQGAESGAVLPFLTHLHQVGQTGATPRHPKGLATCCHGEEPHVVGWRFVNERRAVNLDAGCGWAQGKADVLYVADAFAVMRKLNELLD